MKDKVAIFWLRRDLRWEDNVGLYHALKSDYPVIPLFIFDRHILDYLPKDDARVSFIFDELQKMRSYVQDQFGSSIATYYGYPEEVFQEITKQYSIAEVHTNGDYEPYAKKRDAKIEAFLAENGIEFHTYKDQVFFEPNQVQKKDGGMYLVYTPYMKQWKKNFENENIKIYPSEDYLDKLYQHSRLPNLSLADMGFVESTIKVPNYQIDKSFIEDYEETRNLPYIEGTSRLSPHLRFGTVGYRKILKKAIEASNEVFWNELIWREFYKAILYHYPETQSRSFKAKYDRIEWRNNEDEFERWKNGQTGYPIVDAGMRQLNETGWMHNRVRMIVGSFLCKHLLIDWRWGEAYFAEKLLDYEMSSNIGGWQWVAGSGVDAAPYFRVFNPYSQTDKFDKDKKYIQKWVPEWESSDYPSPIVEHKMARQRCLDTYKSALNN